MNIYTYLNHSTLTCGTYTTLSGLADAHGLRVQSLRNSFQRSGKEVIKLRGGIVIMRTTLEKNPNMIREHGFN